MFNGIQFFPQTFQCMKRDVVIVNNPYSVQSFTLCSKRGDLIKQPGLIFRNSFFPDKGVLVRIRLNLCSVYKDRFAGDLTQ